MTPADAISLINNDHLSEKTPAFWADLGCGSGLFTEALATLLKPGSMVYAVDKKISALRVGQMSGPVILKPVELDFVSDAWPFKNLNGILMANALHFVSDKKSFINKAISYFSDEPRFVFVEYDTDISNPWVPYPVSFSSLKDLFSNMGFKTLFKINEKPSLYNRSSIYSAFISR